MKLRDLVDVEPLSDARWAKLARALFERVEASAVAHDSASTSMDPARPRRSLRQAARAAVWATAMACLIAVAASTSWALRRVPVASQPAPSHIVTGLSGSLLVVGESSIAVSPESAVVVSGDDDHGVLAVVERGRATFSVAPRGGRPPFLVQAGDVGVRVVGTRFTVTRAGDGARVDVDHGTVQVTAGGVTVEIHDGRSWPPADADPGPRALSPPPDHGADLAPPSPADRAAPPGDPLARERSAAPDAAALARAPASEPRAPAPRPSATVRPPSPEDAGDAAVAPPLDGPPAQERFEQAEGLERTDPDRALSVYRDVAAASGPWAMNALFAAGRLQAARGARAEALGLLSDYVNRYPQGPNARDARRLLDRLQ